jgi:hypothetical protein
VFKIKIVYLILTYLSTFCLIKRPTLQISKILIFKEKLYTAESFGYKKHNKRFFLEGQKYSYRFFSHKQVVYLKFCSHLFYKLEALITVTANTVSELLVFQDNWYLHINPTKYTREVGLTLSNFQGDLANIPIFLTHIRQKT